LPSGSPVTGGGRLSVIGGDVEIRVQPSGPSTLSPTPAELDPPPPPAPSPSPSKLGGSGPPTLNL
jgi:hypothetical protein